MLKGKCVAYMRHAPPGIIIECTINDGRLSLVSPESGRKGNILPLFIGYDERMERAEQLPKGDKRRKMVAERLKKLRALEEARSPYNIWRDGADYIRVLNGIQHLFRYVRGLPSKIVLDVGAGTTMGISGVSRDPVGSGLDFHATVLSGNPHIQSNLGKERTHHTSAETLRAFPSESIGCVLGVQSLTYSADPPLVATSIDRVLVPGGVLKTVIRTDRPTFYHQHEEFPQPRVWVEALKSLGYDVAELKDDPDVLIVAIKPGGDPRSGTSARGLLEQDFASTRVQLDNYGSSMDTKQRDNSPS